jgi:hypothetical protein
MTSGQDPRDGFGSILRIDVDHPSGGKPYGIPRPDTEDGVRRIHAP